MRTIPLTQGYSTIVDDSDYEEMSKYKWCYAEGYAVRRRWCKQEKRYYTVKMHREITNAPKGLLVDHKDGNKLNNTRSNLRICTHTENVRNSQKPRNNTTGYKGVKHGRKRRKDGSYYEYYLAEIRVNNKLIVGNWKRTAIEAAMQYNELALKYHGEFARLNGGV